jgi:hypothetical protein
MISGRLAAAVLVVGAAALVLLVALGSGDAAPAALDAAAGPLAAKVKIIIQVNPPEKATIMWGKKSIGMTKGPRKPLIIERPRDSGPMDVVIRAKGFLPVHTRAYTFADTKLLVKLTPEEEKKSVFGYREELPDAGPPEAGAPAAPAVFGPPAPGAPSPDAGAR